MNAYSLMRYVLIYVTTLINIKHIASSKVPLQHGIEPPTTALLQLTLKSIDSGLEFMNREHQNINLDAIIGTRIVEGE